jgi:hypothetical protein
VSELGLWTITSADDLGKRMRESRQTLEHDRRGYFLSQTHERVSPLAVAEERVRINRMSEALKKDPLYDLHEQQQQTRDYVKEMVERLKEVEQEMPKERRQESDQGRER